MILLEMLVAFPVLVLFFCFVYWAGKNTSYVTGLYYNYNDTKEKERDE